MRSMKITITTIVGWLKCSTVHRDLRLSANCDQENLVAASLDLEQDVL
jgi:hypothetical protein